MVMTVNSTVVPLVLLSLRITTPVSGFRFKVQWTLLIGESCQHPTVTRFSSLLRPIPTFSS
jgi:hypothetical protein